MSLDRCVNPKGNLGESDESSCWQVVSELYGVTVGGPWLCVHVVCKYNGFCRGRKNMPGKGVDRFTVSVVSPAVAVIVT